MANVSTITNAGNQITALDMVTYEKQLLTTLKAQTVHLRYVKKATLPKNGGTTLSMRRWENLDLTVVPTLMEGNAGLPVTQTVTAITFTPEQYGRFLPYTDRLDWQSIDNVLSEFTKTMGYQAAVDNDIIIRTGLIACSNIIYGGAATQNSEIDDSSYATMILFERASAFLTGNNCISINADGAQYVAIVHPDIAYTIRQDPNWREINKNMPEKIFKNEVGIIGNTRLVETTLAYIAVGAGSSTAAKITRVKKNDAGTYVNVYYTFVLSFESVISCGLSGEDTPRMYIKPFGSAGSNDPLDQMATIGFKYMTMSKIVDTKRMVCIRSSALITV